MKEFSLPSVAVALLAPGTLPRTAAGKVQRALTRSAIEHGRLDLIASNGFAPARDAAPVA
jgi:acyl-CoA synthetase (AMP-forming)/AMP-acid ligase II